MLKFGVTTIRPMGRERARARKFLMANRGYNILKRRTLAVFSREGDWLRPLVFAALAEWPPSQYRAAYSYLKRLHLFGLLHRRRDARGLLLYRISERGTRRLLRLSRQRA